MSLCTLFFNSYIFKITNFTFSRIIDGTGNDQGLGVACDSSGNIYIAGVYNLTPSIITQFGGTIGILPASAGGSVAFVSKFDSSGTYQYSRIIDSAGADTGYSVACDSSDNVYIAGQYTGTPTIKDQTGTSLATLPVSSGAAGFVSKFNSSGTYQYSHVVDSTTNADDVRSVTCDSSGNMYISGLYNGIPTIKAVNSSNVSTNVATLPESSVQAGFVSKFNSSGTYQYSRVVDSAGADLGLGVACDPSSNMYLAGYYIGTPTIKTVNSSNVSTDVATLPASTVEAAFVSKFNSSGTYQYSRIVDSAGADLGWGVTCDSSSNMYLAGYYTGTPTIKNVNSSNVSTDVATLPASSVQAAFVSKFNSSGTYQYSRIVDSAVADQGYGVACDPSSNMYLSGYYTGTPTIKNVNSSNVSTDVATLPIGSGGQVAFVSKFNSSGTYQYSRVVDSAGADQGRGVTCDSSGNMYLTGQYAGTPTIYAVNSSNVSTSVATLPTSSGQAAFVVKFDSSGNYLPVQTYPTYSRIIDSAAAGSDIGYGVACDSSSNMYVAGYYSGTPDIKTQAGTILATLPVGAAQTAFVCKFDSSGTYQYSRIVDGSTTEFGFGVACDSSSNMYLAGFYTGTATIKTANSSNVFSNVATLPASTGATNAAFASKFNSSGTYQYTLVVDASINDQGYGVACDSSSNMYLAGYYNGTNPTIKFVNSSNVSSNVATLPASSGSTNDVFVSKFDSTGTYQYSRIISSAGTDQGFGVACDSSGNMYVAGYYNGTPTIQYVNSSNVATTVATLRASSGNAGFVSKFDSSGTYQYSFVVDSTTNNEACTGVACDSSGNMYVSGYYVGVATIYSISSSNVSTTIGTLPSGSGAAAFVSKFDSSGTYQYSRIIDTTTNVDQGQGVTCDSSGNMYFTGYYNGTAAIKNQAGTTLYTLPASSVATAFTCKFDSSGNHKYTRLVDSAGTDIGQSVTCDPSGNMYTSGYYSGTATVKNELGSSMGTLPTSSGLGAFVTKFNSDGGYV